MSIFHQLYYIVTSIMFCATSPPFFKYYFQIITKDTNSRITFIKATRLSQIETRSVAFRPIPTEGLAFTLFFLLNRALTEKLPEVFKYKFLSHGTISQFIYILHYITDRLHIL